MNSFGSQSISSHGLAETLIDTKDNNTADKIEYMFMIILITITIG